MNSKGNDNLTGCQLSQTLQYTMILPCTSQSMTMPTFKLHFQASYLPPALTVTTPGAPGVPPPNATPGITPTLGTTVTPTGS